MEYCQSNEVKEIQFCKYRQTNRILLKYKITKQDIESLRERERLAAAPEVNLSLTKLPKEESKK